jgi:hypothetical protein
MAVEDDLGPQIILHDVSKEVVSNDIELFFQEQLTGKVEPASIRELIVRADGLFIFASTLVKHLLKSRYTSRSQIKRRLGQVLAPIHQGGKVGLDSLYDRILNDGLSMDELERDEFEQRLLILQTIVCMKEATTPRVISDLLGCDIDDVMCTVESLHSVLFTRGPSEPIYIVHASFHDFLVHQAGDTFRCDARSIHRQLSRSCLSWMQDHLRFNICNIRSSFIPNDDLPPPLEIIGDSLAYACRYWWPHFKSCDHTTQIRMSPDVSRMMEEKCLFWIEGMTLLGYERDCRAVLKGIAATKSVGRCQYY